MATGIGVVTIGLLVVASRIPLSSDTLRKRVTTSIADYLESDIELDSLTLRLSPRLHVEGAGLVVRYRGRDDVPPLIAVKAFTANASWRSLWRRRVDYAHLDGLQITIPPRHRNAEAPPSDTDDTYNLGAYAKQMVISEVDAPGAELTILRGDPKKPSRIWYLHSLKLQRAGLATAMPFQTLLTNALPPGQVQASGTFGPWHRDAPGETPLDGRFTFDNANLDVFQGISGILSAKGTFGGTLEQIVTDGRTETPDFMVNISGHQVPLTTTYHALIDATNGNTTLDPVHATFLNTALVARGGVYEAEGVKGRITRLDVTMEDGRLEDLMRIAVPTTKAPMSGRVYLRTQFVIPPGKVDVVDKLQLNGRFAIDAGRFTDKDVQKKVNSMSHRARGRASSSKAPDTITSDFRGQFELRRSQLGISSVSFDVPGAIVEMRGQYGLRQGTIDFKGNLFMDAKISETMTGFTSLLLKLADPFFRKDGRTVVPVTISGTRDDPHFGLDMRRVFRAKADVPRRRSVAPRPPAVAPRPPTRP